MCILQLVKNVGAFGIEFMLCCNAVILCAGSPFMCKAIIFITTECYLVQLALNDTNLSVWKQNK